MLTAEYGNETALALITSQCAFLTRAILRVLNSWRCYRYHSSAMALSLSHLDLNLQIDGHSEQTPVASIFHDSTIGFKSPLSLLYAQSAQSFASLLRSPNRRCNPHRLLCQPAAACRRHLLRTQAASFQAQQ